MTDASQERLLGRGDFTDVTNWTLSPTAVYDEIDYYSAPRSVLLQSNRGGFLGNQTSFIDYSPVLVLLPGQPYIFTARMQANGIATSLQIQLDDGITGTYSAIFTVAPSDVPGPWTFWNFGAYTPTNVESRLRVLLPVPGSVGSSNFWIDDLTITGRAQYYPPNNGPRYRGQTWYIDDIMGDMVPRRMVFRDRWGRVRRGDDEDKPGMDEMYQPIPLEPSVGDP